MPLVFFFFFTRNDRKQSGTFITRFIDVVIASFSINKKRGYKVVDSFGCSPHFFFSFFFFNSNHCLPSCACPRHVRRGCHVHASRHDRRLPNCESLNLRNKHSIVSPYVI
ncbi:hypothetical protein PUN28_013651 [Cardiocondyla obscurior]|uniref:Secreted protein n=1 Tax=Cardiocondyla obscurior TaxID=286306 RepID=A0AAW2F5L2_9HYME